MLSIMMDGIGKMALLRRKEMDAILGGEESMKNEA